MSITVILITKNTVHFHIENGFLQGYWILKWYDNFFEFDNILRGRNHYNNASVLRVSLKTHTGVRGYNCRSPQSDTGITSNQSFFRIWQIISYNHNNTFCSSLERQISDLIYPLSGFNQAEVDQASPLWGRMYSCQRHDLVESVHDKCVSANICPAESIFLCFLDDENFTQNRLLVRINVQPRKKANNCIIQSLTTLIGIRLLGH